MVFLVKIIAELGINHKGDYSIAKDLIVDANKSQCWGIKFQYRNIETFYKNVQEIGDEILFQEINNTKLPIEELLSLSDFARGLGLKVGISFNRIEDFKDLSEHINYFDFFKVPSAEATNIPLVEVLVSTGKSVMVSSGGHDSEQIKKAYKKINKDKITIFHCVANYPAKLGSQNLLFINELRDIGFKNIGYSSHDEDYEVCFLAASLGVTWIERHLTKDINGDGLDDSSSSEIEDFFRLSKILNNFELIMGVKTRIPNQGEKLNMQNLGTSLYAKRDLVSGSCIELNDLVIQAPRKGISVGDFLNNYKDKKINRDILQGRSIQASDYENHKELASTEILDFASRNKIALPIRLYDYKYYFDNLNTNYFEFHLSYGEVLSNELFELFKVDSVLIGKGFSIHLPDYIHSNRIIDPTSDDGEVKKESRDIISRVLNFSKRLEDASGNPVTIVGSFSKSISSNRRDNLDRIFNYLDSNAGGLGKILPQWLPVYAWYFGGSARLDIFNSPEDILYIEEYKRGICLDICHIILSANFYKEDPFVWFDRLEKYSKHIHIADGVGVDGEGLQLGDGQLKSYKRFLDNDSMKVLEIWQGHQDYGSGFIKALRYLYNEK